MNESLEWQDIMLYTSQVELELSRAHPACAIEQACFCGFGAVEVMNQRIVTCAKRHPTWLHFVSEPCFYSITWLSPSLFDT